MYNIPSNTVYWPLTQAGLYELQTSQCASTIYVESSETDRELLVSAADIVDDSKVASGYRSFSVNVPIGLLPDGTCCGYDMSPFMQKVGDSYIRKQGTAELPLELFRKASSSRLLKWHKFRCQPDM